MPYDLPSEMGTADDWMLERYTHPSGDARRSANVLWGMELDAYDIGQVSAALFNLVYSMDERYIAAALVPEKVAYRFVAIAQGEERQDKKATHVLCALIKKEIAI